jgi:hypothetical protein
VAPAQLSVFDAKHSRPADAMDVKALRASMSRESDEQMRELAKRPEEFRAVVRGALEVMVHDHLPAEAIVAPGTKRTLQSDGLTVHQRVLMRPGEDQYVPTIELSRSGGSSRIVIWANGCSSIFESDGRTPIAPVQDLLAKGDLVLAADVLLTGQSKPDAGQKLPTVKSETYFAGFRYGYNRTLLADRAHDLLTVIAYAHSRGATEIDLVASDRAAVWSLIACALANGAVHRAAIDIGQFDFNQVHETTNEMFLPGAIRYGGINAIARLCTARIALAHDQSNDLQGLVNSLEK